MGWEAAESAGRWEGSENSARGEGRLGRPISQENWRASAMQLDAAVGKLNRDRDEFSMCAWDWLSELGKRRENS